MIKAIGIGAKPKNTRNIIEEIQKKLEKESNLLFFLTFLHLPVGIFLYAFGSLGVIHPISIFGLGVYWALSQKVNIDRIACLIAYFIGCEVLWRMAELPIFWEFGKYGISAIMIIALLRRGYYNPPVLPMLFILLLIPACIITLIQSSFSEARALISFNISGPIALFISCCFFSHIILNRLQIKNLLICIFIPLLTVAATTLFYTVSVEEIVFNTESNYATSGGFGPNQVSSMLGLGAFIGFTCYFLCKNDLKFNFYFILGALFLSAQSVLTFSRGGMYNALGAIAVLVFFQAQNIIEWIRKISPFFVVVAFFLLIIFPFMNNFTGGKLQERFEDTETTGRTEIIESDLQILSENPILGVGIGNAKDYREKFTGQAAASHTEFSRLISEHGLFGVFSVVILVLMTVLNFLKQESVFGRALIVGSIVWCCLFMLNAGMRLAAPSFFWGLSFVSIVDLQSKYRCRNRIQTKVKSF